MTTVKEIQVQSIAEPAQVKIERNSKGYNYEISVHSETLPDACIEVLKAKALLELELYGTPTSASKQVATQ